MKFPSPDLDWYVARVTPRTEETIMVRAMVAGIEVYLPRRRYDRFNRRQRVNTERQTALLPGYIFAGTRHRAAADLNARLRGDRFKAYGKPMVLGLLGTADGPLQIPSKIVVDLCTDEQNGVFDETASRAEKREAEQIAAALAAGQEVRSYDELVAEHFAPGEEFTVRAGPFTGFLAEVEKLTAPDRLQALVSIFGRMTHVEFALTDLDDMPSRDVVNRIRLPVQSSAAGQAPS